MANKFIKDIRPRRLTLDEVRQREAAEKPVDRAFDKLRGIKSRRARKPTLPAITMPYGEDRS